MVLADDLKSAIKTFRPKTLQSSIELGNDQSALIDALTKKIKGGGCTKNNSINTGGQAFKESISVPPNVANKAIVPKGQIKRLTLAEMSARRGKGLCFNCDERFSPGHKCKHKISFMILCEEEDSTDIIETSSEEQSVNL